MPSHQPTTRSLKSMRDFAQIVAMLKEGKDESEIVFDSRISPAAFDCIGMLRVAYDIMPPLVKAQLLAEIESRITKLEAGAA